MISLRTGMNPALAVVVARKEKRQATGTAAWRVEIIEKVVFGPANCLARHIVHVNRKSPPLPR
jgi:hypothetical protein